MASFLYKAFAFAEFLAFTEKAGIKTLSGETKYFIFNALLIGVVSQVILALVNKWVHWHIYYGIVKKEFTNRLSYKVSEVLSSCVWIDIVADLVSVATFGSAIVKLLFFCTFADTPSLSI